MSDILLLPQVSLIQSNIYRTTTQRRSFEIIGAIYKQLYEACHKPENLYQNPYSLFNRTPEELSKVLSAQ